LKVALDDRFGIVAYLMDRGLECYYLYTNPLVITSPLRALKRTGVDIPQAGNGADRLQIMLM